MVVEKSALIQKMKIRMIWFEHMGQRGRLFSALKKLTKFGGLVGSL